MKQVCGCCEPATSTPSRPTNRPSLSAVAYRIGTFASFRDAMLASIADTGELSALNSRESDDYAITTFHFWAAIADVLTFYQERYANEAFLRTARYRDSVVRLATLLDYRLRPGVAARTWLAFSVDSGKLLTVPARQKVQSVPEEGQQPQTFETLEPLRADARLNRQRIFGPPQPAPALQQGRAEATLDRLTGPALTRAFAPGDRVVLFNDGGTATVEEKAIDRIVRRDDRVAIAWKEPVQRTTWTAATIARKFRRTFRVFGHNAPDQFLQPSTMGGVASRIRWELRSLTGLSVPAGSTLDLDGIYELEVGTRLLIANTAGTKTLVTIGSVSQAKRTLGSLSDTVTVVTFNPSIPAIANRRNVIVYELDGPPLAFWPFRYPAPLAGDTVYLPGVAVATDRGVAVEIGRVIEGSTFKPGVVLHPDDIERHRRILVEDATGRIAAGTVKAAAAIEPSTAVPGTFCHLVVPLTLSQPLGHDAGSAALLGNVADASHGETVRNEVLGNGNRAERFQRFTLKKKPLTFVPGTSAETAASTLEVRVDGVKWTEVSGLFGQAPSAPVFEIRTTDDASTIVQFGDGDMGATLSTGANNVVATYRVGSGLGGRVGPRALTTLLEKPVGLQAAVNPTAAEGGADAESLSDARQNAPRTVRTFGRVVSLQDFEDVVTAPGDIAKAQATWVWDGFDQAIHLTIAGQAGETFSEESRRAIGLRLDAVRDPGHRLRIANYVRIFIEIHAGVAVDPSYESETVLASVRRAITDALSFERLRLGQPIHLSDVYRIIQDVPGVRFVDIDRLLFKRPASMSSFFFLLYLIRRGVSFSAGQPLAVQPHLRIFQARPRVGVRGVVLPAELASIESPASDIVITARS